MKKALLNSIVFLFSIICFSQTIELVRFDNAKTYNPGSGVSMHINPTGIFILDDTSNLSANTNNTFILELSTAGGSFTTATNLGTVDDFYTPLMNGVIPTGTASGEYKLRVRSTNPVTSVESGTFTIDSSTTSALPTATSNIAINTNYFECLNDGANTVNPYFGSLKQAYDATVADMPSAYRFLQIAASNSSNTLNVNLIDIGAGTTTAIPATSPGVYAIPDTLEVGTYNIEVEEVDSSGNSSFFSFTFLFHTSATTFGTPGVDIVCTNTEVEFNVDISILGIGRNYMGSYYTFDWGDGTAVEVLTHAELIEAYTAPLDLISHTFVLPSCTSGGGSSFEVKMDLYNKGLSVNGTDPSCDEYIANGTGASKEIITSDAPQANFTLADEQCITENIVATNTTINGSFPVSDGSCSGEPTFTWYYKPPTASDFIPVFSGSPWLVGNDLIIPSDDITVPGCWTIKLSAVNPDYCQIEDIHEDIINIEAEPDADFDIIELGSIVQDLNIQESSSSSGTGFYTSGNTYTAGQTGKLTSVSMYKNSICDVSGGFSPTLKIYQGQVAFNNAGYVVGSPPLLYQKSFTGSYWNSSNSAYNSTYGIISGWFKMAIPIEDAPTLNSGTQYTILMTGTSCNQFIANLDPSNTDVTFVGSGASQYAIDNYVLRMITTMLVDPASGQNSEVSQICVDDVVTLTDASNIVSSDCESELPNEDPAYQWTISPNSGYTLINSTTLTSQSPQVEFNSVGNYTITQTVTTECGSDSFSSDLEVIGNPTVSFPQDSQTYCSTSTLLIDFANQLTPTYSTGLNAPTSYTWTVTGDGIDSNDYSFASSTTASDALPTIQLNSFGTYNITVTLGSNCDTDASDTISVTLSQTPTITNTDTSQEICSGDTSNAFVINSDAGYGKIYLNGEIVHQFSNVNIPANILDKGVNIGGASSSTADDHQSVDGLMDDVQIWNRALSQAEIQALMATPPTGNEANLVGFWNFENDTAGVANDSSDFSNDGQMVDTSGNNININFSSDTPYASNNTQSFSSQLNGAYIDVPNDDSLNATALTILLWTKLNSIGPINSNGHGYNHFVNKWNVHEHQYVFANNQTGLYLYFGNDFYVSTTHPELNEWEFIGATWSTGTSHSWVATENTNLSGYTSSGTGATIPAQTITNNTNIAQDLIYTITPVSDGCAGTPFEYTITVNPEPLIADKDETICSGETFNVTPVDNSPTEIVPEGTTYSWTTPVSDPVGAITGGSALTEQTSISQTLTNTTTAPATLTYTVTPDSNGCKNDAFDVVITVNPNGQINAIADQTLCDGNSTLEVNFGNSNTGAGTVTYNWTNDNPDIGLAASGTGDIASFTASNDTTAQITGTITATATYTYNDISCEGESQSFTITVNPSPQVDFSQTDQVIVSGETTTAVDLTSPTEDVVFSWTVSVPTGISGVTTTSGTDNIPAETMVNLTTEPLTVVYTAVATGDVGFDCGGLDTLYNVTVNPLAMVNPVNDQIVCNGDNVLVEFSSALSGGNITYSWTNDNSNIGLSNAGTGNIDIIATNTSNQPITGNIVVTPSFENGGNTNIGDPITFTITVNPTGQVSVSDAIQVLSNGFDTNQIAFSTSNIGGTTTYNWTNSDTSIGLAASGSGNINAFTAINTGTSPVTSNLNVIGTFENNGVSCVGPSVPFEITVNPTAQVDQTNDIVVSNGDNVNVPFTTVNTGGTSTYNWTNSDPTIGLADSGSGNIVFTAVNTGTSPITTTVVVTPTFENDGDSNSGPSDTFTITINPTAQVNTINGIVLCNGDNTSTFTFTTENTGGTTTYNWTNDNTSIGLASSGSDSINSFVVVNSTTTAQVATIIVTPTFENGGNSNTGPSETFTITVNPTAQINVINSIINCAGSDSGDIIFTTQNTDGNTTYSWTNDNTDIGLADSGSGNISSFILTNSSTETQIANIVVTPTYTNNGVSCSGADETFTITIPMGQVNPIEDIELCDDDPIAEVIFTTENTIGTTTYDWINDNTSIGLADSGTGNISSFAVINNSDVAQSANITVTPSYNYNGVVCTGPAETFLITINPSAQVDPVASQILCNGDVSNEIIFTTINTDGITTYNWTNDNTTIGLSESGTGDIPAFDVVNTSNNVQISNIIVTPVYDNNGVVCSGPTESFTITVNPSAQINSLETFNTVICYGEFTPVYTFTTSNVDGLTTFNWTNDNASIGLAESGSGGGIPSFQVTNSTTSTIFSTITVTPSYDNNGIVCDGASETFTITVNPSPNVDEIDDITLCNNQESSIISFSTQNTDGNTTYTWTNSNTIIGLDASGEGDIPSFIATNSSAVSESALITVTPVYENNGIVCLGIPEEFGITVLSEIVLSGTPVDADDCENPNSGSIDLLVSGGSGDYSFLWSNGETTEDLSNIPSGEYTVEVTDSEGCTAQSETFTIWRQDDLVVDLQTSFDPNCEGNFVSQINQISISGGVAPYTINWSSGSVSIDDNTIMTAYENGIYNVLVTDSFGCQVNTEIVVDFQEIGDPSFYYTSFGDIDCGISIFNELEFINTSSGDYINVTWDFGDGSEVVSGDIVTHQYLNSGEYTITQIVEYNYGCTEVNVQEIVITDGYNVILPTAFSPNGDGINDTIRPVYSCMNSIEMSIYDTFGSLIYYEDNLELQGWDGILKGKKAENGNYLLVVRAVSIYDEEINLKAVFVLIR